MKKVLKQIMIVLILLVLVLGIATGVYCSRYYHAEYEALQSLNDPPANVTIDVSRDDEIDFIPEEPIAGLVFYPGGKVQCEAYAPLMEKCAEKGILCVLLKVTGNLAILDINAADGVQERFPEVTDWYIGGHSLGGVVAGFYVDKHTDEYKGMVLLAADITNDLSDTGLQVLTMHGTNDGVLTMDRYESDKANLPSDYTEVVIQGGCHSYFGDYGMQEGDGTPEISREDQMDQTAQAVYDMAEKDG